MYARSCKNKVSLDVLQAVCHARARNFKAARIRQAVSVLRGWLA